MIKELVKKIPGAVYLHTLLGPESEVAKQRREFYSQFLAPGDLYFDVGANFGNRIQPVSHIGLRIVAVEPQQECVAALRKKFGNRITVVPKGVGAIEETKTMFISDSSVLSTFSKEWIHSTKESGRFSDYKWDEQRQIQLTTLDNLIDEYGIPQFAKIDVEGFELEVLKGLSTPIAMISLEYAVPEATDNLISCIQRINDISNGDVLCRYSVGESMQWAQEEWLTADMMIAKVKTEEFQGTRFGDVYVKHNPGGRN